MENLLKNAAIVYLYEGMDKEVQEKLEKIKSTYEETNLPNMEEVLKEQEKSLAIKEIKTILNNQNISVDETINALNFAKQFIENMNKSYPSFIEDSYNRSVEYISYFDYPSEEKDAQVMVPTLEETKETTTEVQIPAVAYTPNAINGMIVDNQTVDNNQTQGKAKRKNLFSSFLPKDKQEIELPTKK